MARPSDVTSDVVRAVEAVRQAGAEPENRAAEQERLSARRTEAVSLRLAGLSWEQIAQRLDISLDGAHDLVTRTLERGEGRAVDQLRELENQRLDRAQMAIWTKVLEGDLRAINTFLRISGERSRLNGLYAPQKIEMALSVRQEMESAFAELEALVLEPVEDADGGVTYEQQGPDADPGDGDAVADGAVGPDEQGAAS